MASNLNSEFNYKYQVIGGTEDFLKLAASVSSEDKKLIGQ